MHVIFRFVALVGSLAVLAGCAASADSGADDDPTFRQYTGEAIERGVRYSHLVEWHPLGRNAVRLRLDRNRHFVVELREPCVGHPREADVLELQPAFAGRLRPNDRVALDGRSCLIGDIRPLDYAAWTAAGADGAQSPGGT